MPFITKYKSNKYINGYVITDLKYYYYSNINKIDCKYNL